MVFIESMVFTDNYGFYRNYQNCGKSGKCGNYKTPVWVSGPLLFVHFALIFGANYLLFGIFPLIFEKNLNKKKRHRFRWRLRGVLGEALSSPSFSNPRFWKRKKKECVHLLLLAYHNNISYIDLSSRSHRILKFPQENLIQKLALIPCGLAPIASCNRRGTFFLQLIIFSYSNIGAN